MKPIFAPLVFLLAAIFVIAANAETPKSANAPQYGKWGFDGSGADMKTKPGDDFFRYANGAWIDRVQIPADKAAYSLRLAMTDTTEKRLRALIEEAAKKTGHNPATIEGKVGAFYKSFMDEGKDRESGRVSVERNNRGDSIGENARKFSPP